MRSLGPNNHTAPEYTTAPISDEQWSVYRQVIAQAREKGIPFALGGGLAVSVYTGHWRESKDLDIYILPHDRDSMIDITRRVGLVDYFDQRPYDRTWIYRSCSNEVIVDLMWAMANHRAPVDESWLLYGAQVNVNGEHLRVLPVEEMIWDKLYVLQRDRCDWPEAMKLIYAAGPTLDWEHLLERMGEDLPLLAGVISVFRWICPGRAHAFPRWIWERLELSAPQPGTAPDTDRSRVELLDRRGWFAAPEPAIC
ncbi:MAG TPA: nucleotidyltransferase [Bryobacteraceae bacterium]|nr:nucleotidyltransferase [Bryobacteraceae bacterium]